MTARLREGDIGVTRSTKRTGQKKYIHVSTTSLV